MKMAFPKLGQGTSAEGLQCMLRALVNPKRGKCPRNASHSLGFLIRSRSFVAPSLPPPSGPGGTRATASRPPRFAPAPPVPSSQIATGKLPESGQKTSIVFEEHWTQEAVQAGLKDGLLVQGRLHVPSFQTDVAYVLVDEEASAACCSKVVSNPGSKNIMVPVTGYVGRNRSLHGDTVAALPLWNPWRGSAKALPAEAAGPPADRGPQPETEDCSPAKPEVELSGTEAQKAKLLAAVVAMLRNSEERALPLSTMGQVEEIQSQRKGLGSLRRALSSFTGVVELVEEGDPPEFMVRLLPQAPAASPRVTPEISAVHQSLSQSLSGGDGAHTAEKNPIQGLSWQRSRCRVVAVLERPANAGEIVALLTVPSPAAAISNGSTDAAWLSTPLKVQPRDRRLPAFWLSDHLQHEKAEATGTATGALTRDKPAKPPTKRERKSEAAFEAALSAKTSSLSHQALVSRLKEAASSGSSGLLCVVKFQDWPRESLSPSASLVEVLGPSGTHDAESKALMAFYGLEWRPFPKEIEQQLQDVFPDGASVVEAELAAGRKDLRHLRCVTIDPPHARDLDDAVSVDQGRSTGTLRVGVHVADVTHFVRPGSAADKEARRRATTVYLVGRVYPMLPRWLSENLCSLLPDGDRLSFSVFFTLDQSGNLVTTDPPEICRAVIRTRAKLNYKQVDLAFRRGGGQEEEGVDALPSELLDDLASLAAVTAARRQLRIQSGAVVLERSSVNFEIDEDGRVQSLVQESASSVSHNLIEELMVLANHIVASQLVQGSSAESEDGGLDVGKEVPQAESQLRHPLLRRHPNTEKEVREQIFKLLPEELHSSVPGDVGLGELLEWCRRALPLQAFEAVSSGILEAMKEAEYVVANLDEEEQAKEPEELGHWALSLPTYMHFTSPIRRYADVLVHRRLAFILESTTAKSRGGPGAHTQPTLESEAATYRAFVQGLKEAVERCNAKKRDAQDAQLDAIQLALSDFVQRQGTRGVDVDNAVITKVLLPKAQEDASPVPAEGRPTFRQRLTSRTLKEALEFYIPLAQSSRSVSLEALNLEMVEPASTVHETGTGVRSLRVRVRGTTREAELRTLEPLKVRLLCEQEAGGDAQTARRWTVRLPWALEAPAPPLQPQDVAAPPIFDSPQPPPPPPISGLSGCLPLQ